MNIFLVVNMNNGDLSGLFLSESVAKKYISICPDPDVLEFQELLVTSAFSFYISNKRGTTVEGIFVTREEAQVRLNELGSINYEIRKA